MRNSPGLTSVILVWFPPDQVRSEGGVLASSTASLRASEESLISRKERNKAHIRKSILDPKMYSARISKSLNIKNILAMQRKKEHVPMACILRIR